MRRPILVGLAVIACSATRLLAADGDAARPSPPVEQLLKKESAGETVDRSSAVDPKQQTAPFDAWCAGLVKVDGAWKLPEELNESVNATYSDLRDSLQNSLNGHLELARWCKANKMPETARAHYYAILEVNPNNLEARTFLKHVLIDGDWVDAVDLKRQQADVQDKIAKMDDWSARLKKIVAALRSGNDKKVSRALTDLEGIQSDDAVLALEFWAANIDDDLAKPLVRQIAAMKSKDACQALMRIAVGADRESIRSVATDALRKYPLDFFIPDLLSQLRCEQLVENDLVAHPDGFIEMNTVLRYEMQNRHNEQVVKRQSQVLSVFEAHERATAVNANSADVYLWYRAWKEPRFSANVTSSATKVGEASLSLVYVPTELYQSMAESMAEEGRITEEIAKRKNRLNAEEMIPIFRILKRTTGVELEDKPQTWWAWWTSYRERYKTTKPVNRSYRVEDTPMIVAGFYAHNPTVVNAETIPGKVVISRSCLTAGTLVQTASGLVPVEKIQVGDRVLSQNSETAELCLKPVLLTTVRPPSKLIKIELDSNTIEATRGHLWWVSGKGWLKTCELEAGMRLHTTSGNVEIRQVQNLEVEEPTYNLVVDDFHTYFVGPDRVLSYDNSELKPTLHTVPGFGLVADTVGSK